MALIVTNTNLLFHVSVNINLLFILVNSIAINLICVYILIK